MFNKAVYHVGISEERNSRNEFMLEINASLNNQNISIPTNIFVKKSQFKNEEVVNHEQSSGLNAMISKIIMDIQATEIDAFKHDIDLTPRMLYTMYVEKVSSTTPLINFAEHVMKYCTNRKQITKDKYLSVVKAIDTYCPGVCLEDIDIVWLKKYENRMLGKGNLDSTVWAHMKIIRSLFNEAIKRDMIKPNTNPFKLYEIPEIRSRTDVLSFTEVEELELMGFRKREDRIVRDMFCFACYTGLRWSDLKRLTKDNFHKIGNVTWLKINTQKTGAYVQIPVSIIYFGNALRILEKYGDVRDLFSYVCNGSVNRVLKGVIEQSGVGGSQRITMHTARRSFITGLSEFGVPLQTIQKLAGHARITTTQKYLVLSTKSIQKDLELAFSNKTTKTIHIELSRPEVIKVSCTGKRLFAGSDVLRCKNCSFFQKYRCKLFKSKRKVDDWCDSFSERLDAGIS